MMDHSGAGDRSNVIARNAVGTEHASAEELDERRMNSALEDYLCKLEEAREWLSQYVEIGAELEVFLAELPKGEWLASVAKHFDPSLEQQPIHVSPVREYLHTDNINMFLSWLRRIRLSRHFLFEVIDLYESKNIPSVIYCIHGLARFLSRRGVTTGIERRTTRSFSAADCALVESDLSAIQARCFEDISGNLDSEDSEGGEDQKEEAGCESRAEDGEEGNEQDGETKTNDLVGREDSLEVERTSQRCGRGKQHGASSFSAHSPGTVISSFLATLLWRLAQRELFAGARGGAATVWALRRLARSSRAASAALARVGREAQRVQREIVSRFKSNDELQGEKEGILRSIRLLLENQARLRGMSVRPDYASVPRTTTGLQTFRRALYTLLQDHSLLFRILLSGAELPLRVFFPDTPIGDYHFSRFVEHVRSFYAEDENAQQLVRCTARAHFLSSRSFAHLKALFDNGPGPATMELSPVAVAMALRAQSANGRRSQNGAADTATGMSREAEGVGGGDDSAQGAATNDTSRISAQLIDEDHLLSLGSRTLSSSVAAETKNEDITNGFNVADTSGFNAVARAGASFANTSFAVTERQDSSCNYSRQALTLDEAIRDSAVRREIVRRASAIVAYLKTRLEGLRQAELPFYVRLFVDTPLFFEDFIEPAILLSQNFVAAELVRYVFYSKDLFERRTMEFEQERLYYYNCRYDVTSEFDFTDYSPLRDFLESGENRRFAAEFVDRKRAKVPAGLFFLSSADSSNWRRYEIAITADEVNRTAAVLRQHVSLMDEPMRRLVSQLGSFGQGRCSAESGEGSEAPYRVAVGEEGILHVSDDLKNLNEAGCLPPLIVPSQAEAGGTVTQQNSSEVLAEQTSSYSAGSSIAHSRTMAGAAQRRVNDLSSAASGKEGCAVATLSSDSHLPAKHRFRLVLDTQYAESCESAALEAVFRDLRTRLVLLVAVSSQSPSRATLHDIVYSAPSDEENERYAEFVRSLGDQEPLVAVKKRVAEDLSFFCARGYVSASDSANYGRLLAMLARDVALARISGGRAAIDEIALNSETLDALYKQECILRQDIRSLIVYSRDLFSSMAINRSGLFFNRQSEPKSRYGTYVWPLAAFKPVFFAEVRFQDATLAVSMDEPLLFSMELRVVASSGSSDRRPQLVSRFDKVGFDELLKLAEDGVRSFDFRGVCALSVPALVAAMNEKYIRVWE